MLRKQKLSTFAFFIALILVIFPANIFADSNQYLNFNEYGFKLNSGQLSTKALFNTTTVEWETLPSESNVPLDKMWTIEFSRAINSKDIDAVVIEQGNQYIPVTISNTVNNKLVVSPRDGFAGNTNYVLKVLLSNGKRYKMDFKTRASNRSADIEPNNTYLGASKVYLNEIIDGEITKGDVDFFKVEVPTYGTLNINLTGFNNKGMSLHLYGPNGDNSSYMKSKTNFTQGGISEGLMPGTYYIRVSTYYSSDYSPYELEVNFVESKFEDDNGASNYLNSKLVDLNSSFTGHIGYFSDYNYGNYSDFFKVEIPNHGTLNINLTGFNNKGMSLYLYGPNGDNSSYMKSKTNFTQGEISEGLMPGTYYIKVTTYYSTDYSPYELEVNFVESKFEDDNGASNYLNSKLVGLNSSFTGHIGYFSDYNYGNYNDFFKVEVPTHGTLNINLTGFNNKGMSLYLYGPNGDNNSSMKSRSNFIQGGISEGLRPGTYYIKVTTYYSSDYSPYELEVNFVESKLEDDNGVYNYLESELIDINSSFTGHVGYFSGYNHGNVHDFFKIEVPKEGVLDVSLTGFNNSGMSLYLYGSNGDNSSSMKNKINFTQGGISTTLTPGVYYIKVTTYYSTDYSPYQLDLEFH